MKHKSNENNDDDDKNNKDELQQTAKTINLRDN